MREFTQLPDLLAEIAKDKEIKMGPSARYPARFILLDDFYNYLPLIEKLGVKKVDLADLMDTPSSWFGHGALIDIVNNQEENAVVYPVSEILRFYKQEAATAFLASVMLRENTAAYRLYIPLAGVKDRFLKFWNGFNRKNEGPPVWYLRTPEDCIKPITAFICDPSIESSVDTVSNNQEWITYWKTDRITPIITKSPSLKHRWEEFLPNGCFEKESIETPRDLLAKIHRIDFKKPYQASETHYWNSLLKAYEDNPEYKGLYPNDVLERILGIKYFADYRPVELLQYYLNCNLYQRWLVVTAVYQNDMDDNYLDLVLCGTESYSDYDLVYRLYHAILTLETGAEKYLEERKALIEALPLNLRQQTNSFMAEFMDSVQGKPDHLKLITNYTQKEKEYLICQLLPANGLDELFELFPDIQAYLDWDANPLFSDKITDSIRQYFAEYNLSKLRNKKTESFDSVFIEFNESKDTFYKWYYGLEPITLPEGIRVLQLDGVGAEWLPYISHLIKQNTENHNKVIKEIGIRRVALPTITTINKLVEDQRFLRDYDQNVIHRLSGYSYPISLIDGMERIGAMIRDYVLLSPDKDIIITADHGATCLCQTQFGCVALHKDMASNHEGRYLKNANALAEDSFFMRSGDYLIALKHNVLTMVPHRETHGGATPEEIIVPFIHVITANDAQSVSYKIHIKNPAVEFSSRKLYVAVNPKPQTLPELIITGKRIKATLEKDLYGFPLDDIESGKHKIKLEIDKQLYNDNIELLTGFIQEDLFDE